MSYVSGYDDGIGYGVRGFSLYGRGVLGWGSYGHGVVGWSNYSAGVYGGSTYSYGVYGRSCYSAGVYGDSFNSNGVYGRSLSGFGTVGQSYSSYGVYGVSYDGIGVSGWSNSSYGVYGYSDSNVGVHGRGDSRSGAGVSGYSISGYAIYGRTEYGHAAYLDGRVYIRGPLQKPGGRFKIDHPLDPANKYLSHSFVESPDMKNVYDGVVTLDDNGEAEIDLPDWFGALNKDFRYQLTAIGAPGPNLYIAEEISDGVTNYSNSSSNNKTHFNIAGGTSGMKVSWQVTGIRKDPWANANRIEVEEDKPPEEQGYYIYPDLYGKAVEKGISRLLFPEEERKKQQLLVSE